MKAFEFLDKHYKGKGLDVENKFVDVTNLCNGPCQPDNCCQSDDCCQYGG